MYYKSRSYWNQTFLYRLRTTGSNQRQKCYMKPDQNSTVKVTGSPSNPGVSKSRPVSSGFPQSQSCLPVKYSSCWLYVQWDSQIHLFIWNIYIILSFTFRHIPSETRPDAREPQKPLKQKPGDPAAVGLVHPVHSQEPRLWKDWCRVESELEIKQKRLELTMLDAMRCLVLSKISTP